MYDMKKRYLGDDGDDGVIIDETARLNIALQKLYMDYIGAKAFSDGRSYGAVVIEPLMLGAGG